MAKSHGHSARPNSPTYNSWQSMIQRTRNPNSKYYSYYGGRGITVCESWRTFANFLADMGERPAGMTLDREDNNKSYEPGNCRWATRREQQNNTNYAVMIPFEGRLRPLSEVSELTGLSRRTITKRINRGWPEARWFEGVVGKGDLINGEKNGHAKLTEEQALDIIVRRRGGERAAVLAIELGVSQGTINDVYSGRRWGHLQGRKQPDFKGEE